MKVLIVGNGGREHALAWKVSQSTKVDHVFVAPGNAGTATEDKVTNIDIAAENISTLKQFAIAENINLTIVGPEVPLVAGIVDTFQASGLKIFGPTAAAAQLEGSKAFTKDFLARFNIPTANYQVFTNAADAIVFVENGKLPIVIKADGLAAGKGVIIAEDLETAESTIKDMLAGNSFGEAGHRVIIEEFLEGEEVSFICMVDGKNILPMATSQDHKARDNGDKGPNTGGMGAYSPAPIVTPQLHDKIIEQIIRPTVNGMAAEGAPFTGFLYAGLMISDNNELKTIEYNVRFGDPETQPILMRLRSDLIDLCLAALDGKLNTMTANWDERVALGVVMAAGGYPNSYAKDDVINGLHHTDDPNYKIFQAGTRLNHNNEICTSGGRVLCVTGLGQNIIEAQQKAYSAVKKITWENMYFRDDIGYRAVRRLESSHD